MHTYLRAIGFSDSIKSEYEVDILLDNLLHTYDERTVIREEDGQRTFMELSKSFGPKIGIRLCGEVDRYGFHRLYYYPYLVGAGVTTEEEITVEMKVNGECYTGMVDEGKVGVSLIFYLQNPAEYRKKNGQELLKGNKPTVTLSGLSLSGMILLPMKDDTQDGNAYRNAYYTKHDSLVNAAKNGSEEAIEQLTLEDMDTYAMITRRIMYEDVLSIVDSYFMPYGMECDQYQILGTILFFTKVSNNMTKESLYQMTIECNGLTFDICINEKDLLGEPDVGRRFKGNIWLQGNINFE